MVKIVCVGLACIDYLFWQSEEKPSGLEKAKGVEKWIAQGGGMAATAAVAASRLGAEVKLITKIGKDEIGKKIAKELMDENVKLDNFSIIEEGTTPCDFIKVTQSGDRTFHYFSGKNLKRPFPKEKDIEGDAILVDKAYPELSMQVAKTARKKKIKVIADLEEKIGKEEKKLLTFTDHAIIDEKAAKSVDPDLKEALRKLSKKVELAVVTCGKEGAYYCMEGGIKHQPSFKVKTVDTTGAGDVFHGAYAFGLANKWPIKKTMEFSAASAALACKKLGGRSAIPSKQEVENFY